MQLSKVPHPSEVKPVVRSGAVCVGWRDVSFATIAVDRVLRLRAIPQLADRRPGRRDSDPRDYRDSMVTLAALVLTITMVVVQLAMGQFSPRIVQTFLQDKPSQLAIGLFVATFAHAMLAMREVIDFGDGTRPRSRGRRRPSCSS